MADPNFSPAALISLCLVLAACAGKVQPTNYYLLEQATSGTPVVDGSLKVAVAVGPIRVADYLDQTLIVTRLDDGSLELNEQARWASPLQDSLQEAVIDRLAARFPNAAVAAFPASHGFQHAYRIGIDIVRLDGTPGETAFLKARWRILRTGSEKQVAERRFSAEKAVGDGGIRSLLGGQSELVVMLADAIADYMRSLPTKAL